MWFKSNAAVLGDFEQLVLLGVLRLGDDAYGAAIRQEIHARSGRDVSINAVYTTLDRLESKGSSDRGSASRRRSGAAAGASSTRCGPPAMAALRQAYRAFTAMAVGLETPAGDEVSARRRLGSRSGCSTRRLSAEWRDFVLGDLEEEFTTRSRGVAVARRAVVLVADRSAACARTATASPTASTHRRRSPPGDPIMRTLPADLRYSLRVLLRAPSFALAVVARPRARHRRQHRDLQHRQRRAAAAAAVRRARPPRAALPRAAAERRSRACTRFSVSPANFYDWQRERAAVRRHGAVPVPAVRADRQRQPRKRVVAGAVGAGLLRGRARAAGCSAACSSRRKTRRAADTSSILSDGFWKSHFGARSRRRRPHADARRRGVHRSSASCRRAFSVDGVGRRRHRDIWVPLALHGRASAPSATTTTTRSSRG